MAGLSFHVAEDGCRIAYEVTGQGPSVLLIPGLGGSGTFWKAIAPVLASRYSVISVDHRGAGRSDRPKGRYSIEQIARDCAGIAYEVASGPVHVVGHSTGGMVAQTLALDHAGLVRSLVLSGTWVRLDAQLTEMFLARAEVLQRAGPETYQRLTHALGFPGFYFDAHKGELEAAVAAASATLSPIDVSLERLAMLGRTQHEARLGEISVPTLVVAAEDDPLIPFRQSVMLRETIPEARLMRLNGSHFFPRVHPDRFAELVLDFLEEFYVTEQG